MMMKYNKWQKFLIVLFIAAIFAQNILSSYHTSILWDERCYIGLGKYILKSGNFLNLNALGYHPPLSFYLNSIFLVPVKFKDGIYQKNDCWDIGNDILFNSRHNPFLIEFLARLPFIIMSAILSILVLKFAENMYGVKSALLAMFLYTFSVTIIADSSIAYTDFLVTFFIFLTIYSFWKLMNNYSIKNLFLTGIFFGLAQLSKMTALILVPCITILALIEFHRKANLNKKHALKIITLLAFIFITGFVVIWAGYGFTLKPIKEAMPKHYSDRAYEEIDKRFSNPFLKNLAINSFEKIYLPAPSYFFGLAAVYHGSAQKGREGFFFGKIIEKSVWYYQGAVFALKTQLSLIILIIITIIFFRKIKSRPVTNEFYLLIPIIILFFAFTINKLVSGVAHILPAYPFLFVFASRTAKIKSGIIKAVLALLILHYLLSSVIAFPNYYSYFNEIIGGSANGYKYMGSGNFDGGQNLPKLKDFMDANGIKKINLSYLGSADPKDYGINYDYMPSPYFAYWVPDYVQYIKPQERNEDCSRRNGWVAVSASNLQGVYLFNRTCFSWLNGHNPLEKISNSIFVYNLSN